ncbi:unnamed protein product [Calicophoron daubneyi]|uniref:CRAL-TRIO domain-containing protein n=1 Tax=Calicophoron daubneyi TaxID=300641 RepID=A0AAV2TQS0_CALDB
MVNIEPFELSSEASLNGFYLTVAKNELREIPDHVSAHIISLKRWMNTMPHLTCPDDDRIYRAFLRQAKYDHARAEKRMDNFCTLRTSDKMPSSVWFDHPNLSHPMAEDYLKMGMHIPAGFLNDGTFLFMVRPGVWDPNRLPFAWIFRMATMHIDRIIEDPRVQISGIRVMLDMTGVTSAHMNAMNPSKNGKEMIKLFQEGYPMRVKSFIFYNEPPFMDIVLKILMTWMKPKLKERIIHSKNDIEIACQRVPGLRKTLPKDYGGDGRSLEEIIREQNAAFRRHYIRPGMWDGMKVDESKRPDFTKNYMMEYNEGELSATRGTTGTYIALPEED